ncbi:MAG TPA: serine/threonine-protein kinase [Thermoanaerobaculia bacterium]|nr:serine/threonine-protein kinase [Thermoanaerobaculia bacterium]
MNLLRIAHYRVLEHLGSGGRGDVYVAEDTRLRRKVALKIVRDPSDESRRQLFLEAHYASIVNHPNVVAVHDIGVDQTVCFVATEYIEGESLRQRLERGPLPVTEALDVAMSVGAALSAAHEVWLVHRDVKPENIMIRHDQFVKVVDFGVAKLMAAAVPVDPLRERIELVGTLAYLSPEQVRGDLVDNRSDIYSLGVVLYEMLTGSVPFESDDVMELLAAIVEEDLPPLPDHLPAALQRIVGKALDKNVFTRYQTACDLIADLRALRARLTPRLELV